MAKIVTGIVRFSYVNVFAKKAIAEGGKEKYSVNLIISKDDLKTLEKIEKAINQAKQEGLATFGGKIPKKLKLPLRDGDDEREDKQEYENAYFLNCSSDNQPNIVDADLDPIINPKDFYSGCYGRASINFYAFNVNGNQGIAVGLNSLQKLRDGENLSGAAEDAEEVFGNEPVEDWNDLM